MRFNTRRRTAVATATGLPRYARNDKVGTHDWFRAYGVGRGAQPSFRPTLEPRGFTLTPTLSHRGREGGRTSSRVAPGIRASTLICHCEEHSDVAISMGLNTHRRTAVATATGLPRYARNDKVGTHDWFRAYGVGRGAQPSFRPTLEPRGFTLTPTLSHRGRGRTSSRVAPGIRASTLICHCEEHSDVAISMGLNTRRGTAVATATGLPRYARNDTVGALEGGHSSSGLATVYYYGLPRYGPPSAGFWVANLNTVDSS